MVITIAHEDGKSCIWRLAGLIAKFIFRAYRHLFRLYKHAHYSPADYHAYWCKVVAGIFIGWIRESHLKVAFKYCVERMSP